MPGKICIILARHHLFSTFLLGKGLAVYAFSQPSISEKVSALPTEEISFSTKKTGLTRLFSFGAADRI